MVYFLLRFSLQTAFKRRYPMIRLILTLLFVVLFLVLSIPVMLIELVIGKLNPRLKDFSSLRIVQWAFGVVAWLSGAKVTVIGKENIPKDTAVLFVANHRSYFDIVLTYMRMPNLTGYIAKKEMLKWPLLRVWMKYLHCLFLDRDNVKEGLKTILTAIEKVKQGISIFIFPEGTRNKENDTFLPFHDGSFKIAEKSGVPVIPIAIVNSASILEDHMPWIKKTSVVIEFLKPVDISQLDKETKKHIGNYISDQIREAYFIDKEKYF